MNIHLDNRAIHLQKQTDDRTKWFWALPVACHLLSSSCVCVCDHQIPWHVCAHPERPKTWSEISYLKWIIPIFATDIWFYSYFLCWIHMDGCIIQIKPLQKFLDSFIIIIPSWCSLITTKFWLGIYQETTSLITLQTQVFSSIICSSIFCGFNVFVLSYFYGCLFGFNLLVWYSTKLKFSVWHFNQATVCNEYKLVILCLESFK